jgi:16S rRNA (adenine1518-N6/adenine1519-N6)-dimethyltransferase
MHQARKRFGQHFLHDDVFIQRIIDTIRVRKDQHLVEIGPGKGALTVYLLQAAGELDAIELDRDLAARLPAVCADHGTLRLHTTDALKFDFRSLVDDARPLRIVGNLPYNISSPLLFHLVEQADVIEDMHFMLQKEVVNRITATPGGRDYGRLSVMLQYRCRAEHLFDVPAEAFTPPPRVTSAVVRLTPYRKLPVRAKNESSLARVVNAAFMQRRKTLRNSLGNLLSSEQIAAAGIDPGLRAEMLTIEEFVALSDQLPETTAQTPVS